MAAFPTFLPPLPGSELCIILTAPRPPFPNRRARHVRPVRLLASRHATPSQSRRRLARLIPRRPPPRWVCPPHRPDLLAGGRTVRPLAAAAPPRPGHTHRCRRAGVRHPPAAPAAPVQRALRHAPPAPPPPRPRPRPAPAGAGPALHHARCCRLRRPPPGGRRAGRGD